VTYRVEQMAEKRKNTDPMHFTPYKAKKAEEYMNSDQEAHFSKILENWRLSLMKEVDRTVGHMKDDAAYFPDPNDRASQETEFSIELRTRDRERKLLKKITETLDLIDSHEYGFCESCGADIGIRRLEARPTANLCIECKTLQEIREKNYG
jgi:DnaK suppressor protein